MKAAREKKGKPKAATFEGSTPRSAGKHLWECIYHLNAIITDAQMLPGQVPEKLSERLDQIAELVPRARQALRERKVIS